MDDLTRRVELLETRYATCPAHLAELAVVRKDVTELLHLVRGTGRQPPDGMMTRLALVETHLANYRWFKRASILAALGVVGNLVVALLIGYLALA